MTSLYVDTNTYSEFRKGLPDARYVLSHSERIVVPVIVLGELRAGFAYGTRQAQNEQDLREFLSNARVSVARVTNGVAAHYGMIYAQLRRDAKPIPTNDIWIAAVVSFYKGTALYTQDPHFQHVRGLQIVPDAATFRKIFE